MGKRLWILLLLIIAVFAGVVWADRGSKAVEAGAEDGTPPVHIIGKQDATVKLVEYSDFQCAACAAYYPIVEQVIEKYKDKISFEYRHYPLTTIHRNAFAAARASEAADKQGKFWEMYRLLFSNQSAWENSSNAQSVFESYAGQLGLDPAKFKADFTSKGTNSAINASIAEFNTRGLPKATPTFLLNDKKIEPRSVEDFSKLIDEQLGTL